MKTRENWIKENRRVIDGESSPYYSNEGDFLYALDQTEEMPKQRIEEISKQRVKKAPKLRTKKAWRKRGRKIKTYYTNEINLKGKKIYPKSSTKKIKGKKNDKN